MQDSNVRILVVDDEPLVRKSLCSWLDDAGYSVETACSGEDALEKLSRPWDIYLIDIRMPGMDGLELQRRISELQPESTVVIMTAYASVETAVAAMKQGAYDYIVKPFEPEALQHLIRKAVERKRLITETARLRRRVAQLDQSHGLVGHSAAIRRVLEEVDLVAETETTVLIRGESGTGKELVARGIHAKSRRRFMPVVIVSSGALSEGVLESELFGHEKGAFTGADYRRKGKFEQADGGTLFLDEIGDISLKTQIDLLRVLGEKVIFRVGGSQAIPVDFRLVAATNRDLEGMVADGDFREDLYYRLNVYSISIPPLRRRREDIPLLADHFLELFAQSMNKPIRNISAEAMRLLSLRDWPGNVRELQNVMERAVLLCQTDQILPSHLPSSAQKDSGSLPPPVTLAELEQQHIQRMLKETNWNISQAARLLAIDRVTLYNKIKKYGLKRETASGSEAERTPYPRS